ncbi:alpha/beta hydrolase [Photobacterium satsumensis]|uniref:alpha/beta hydrolase n=1 Tax=Photobacterium satsumensis TaxID=2910239 RepID=UPI003D1391B8
MKLKSMLMSVALILPLASPTHYLHASSPDQSTGTFFSLTEIKGAETKPLSPLEYIQATDGVSLAYRSYLPQQTRAILVFYHGAGAHSGLTYNHIGTGLRDNFDIAVYMPDIRGHGGSGGERGDSPNVEQVWSDINSVVEIARNQYPDVPIFVGGHSSGAGLVLNYSSWGQRAETDGYVFLSPYFGFRSETNYDESEKKDFQFSTVDTADFILNSMSGGLFFGHSKAVKFNFPDAVLKKNPEIVPFNTVNMSNAVTPSSPDTQLLDIQQFGLWIGEHDEAFDPIKVVKFAEGNSNIEGKNEIKIVDMENHFSIILIASELIGPWLTRAAD